MCHFDLSLGHPADRNWSHPPGHPRNRWLDQLCRDKSESPADLWRQAISCWHSGDAMVVVDQGCGLDGISQSRQRLRPGLFVEAKVEAANLALTMASPYDSSWYWSLCSRMKNCLFGVLIVIDCLCNLLLDIHNIKKHLPQCDVTLSSILLHFYFLKCSFSGGWQEGHLARNKCYSNNS